ncbi:2-methoxy-6-polyprenyl-1,4-benzoquinol methylase, mitochondrial-like, partial [Diaphorina citri]|uniref:2-methoxy-6-polyprenyl-1,4-benzoquinol methylase, mitochondrial-like n=1 Tax=Diaphorina citri TaxID=121845 RepID=A0A1S3DNA2_DIACI
MYILFYLVFPGDIAFRFLNYVDKLPPNTLSEHCAPHVTVADINRAMLDVGEQRARDLFKVPVPNPRLRFLEANAEELPIESDSYSAYTIAFGIRNVTRIDKALSEAYRVLKPGGRFLCLEFSHVNNSMLQCWDEGVTTDEDTDGYMSSVSRKSVNTTTSTAKNAKKKRRYNSDSDNEDVKSDVSDGMDFGPTAYYSFQVIPVMGQLIAGQWKPYQYLVESIRQFPNQVRDIAFRFLNYVDKLPPNTLSEHCAPHVTVADINRAMLDVGEQRARDLFKVPVPNPRLRFLEANAEELPIESDSYSAYTIAFGIRNVTRIDKALSEAYRVLKPGGRFLCLEFSHVNNSMLQ